MSGRVLPFRGRPLSSEAGIQAAERVLATPFDERAAKTRALHLEDPETLLALCGILRERMGTSPASVRDEAEFLYRFIESPKRDIGLFDERDYFLGETALLAGNACRNLSLREEAWIWFDRAEAGFRHTMNAPAEMSRLAYQKLAERFEERQLDLVIELLPSLVESFKRLGMPEDALKCRFLEGLAHVEKDEPSEAVQVFNAVCIEADALGSERLLAESYGNLIHAHGMLGEAAAAVEASRRAIPVLTRLDDRIALAKVHWGLAILLRETGHLGEAIDSYRKAQEDFETIGMRADVAALNLVVADLLLEEGKTVEALREISEALPVISELKMAPEGMAALSLVRESARRQEINRQALRELHGYFQDLQN
ncbi:MAG TPA: tetratricopeptide repeat protein [Thermoanaerobaculia bacterium]|nr:tetratricopeptide repeat protein [Thermoanaerobaculia bacterium]